VTYVEAGYRHVLPWFLPGTALFALVGVLAARPLARWLPTHPVIAWGLFVSLGMVLSATLTPLRGHFNFAATGGTCDLSRIGLAPIDDLGEINDTTLNILLFIPLGISLGLLDRSRRTGLLIAVAVVLPVMIETTQLLLPALERGCQSADVFDNLTGLVIGLAIGGLASLLALTLPGD
jgi:glycopeptide antibiotics resistance protein